MCTYYNVYNVKYVVYSWYRKTKARFAKSLIQLRFGDPSVKPVKLHYVGDIKSPKEVH